MKIENFVSLRDRLASEGVATVELLSIKHIKTVNINFRPAKRLKESVKSEGFGTARGVKMRKFKNAFF